MVPHAHGARSGAAAFLLSFAGCLWGCEPNLEVGDLTCAPGNEPAPLQDNGSFNDGPLPAPWQDGFEDGFCGYRTLAGFCYAPPGGASAYRLVTQPVHSGAFAAAFDLGLDGEDAPHQTRCVREGVLPESARYGAWYYIPSGTADPVNWNLFFFQAREPGKQLDGLWDVSIDQTEDGGLALYLLDHVSGRPHHQTTPMQLPTDRWVHIEFYLKLAGDDSGEVALWQDGEELLRVTGVTTGDARFGQWYVGNLAISVSPPRATLYVDDVTVELVP